MPEEPDIKRENLADSDASPFGDTTEHAGEQDTEEGATYADPENESVDGHGDEEERFPSTESAASASPGEGEGAESAAPPDSERMANREDVCRPGRVGRGDLVVRPLLLMFRGAPGRLGRVNGTARGVGHRHGS